LIELMPERSPGVISHRDALSVGFSDDELLVKMREFVDLGIDDEEVAERYSLRSNDRWILRRRREALGGRVDRNLVRPLLFRPFDRRVIYDEVNVVGDRRERLREHLARVPNNMALITARSATPEASYTFVSRAPGTQALMSSRTRGAAVYLPLYVVPATGNDQLLPLGEDETTARPNLDAAWSAVMALTYGPAFTPETLAGYLYAILGSDTYRERVADALSDDFPRVPLTADPQLFAPLAELGSRVVSLDLREIEPPGPRPRLSGVGDLTVENFRYEDAEERVWITKPSSSRQCQLRRGRPRSVATRC
jgi:hypothetical protein